VQELGGSTARQPAQVGQWKYSITWTSHSVYEGGVGQRAGCSQLFLFSGRLKPLLNRSSNFYGSLVSGGSFEKFSKICEFVIP